jgi:acetylornithine/succinyldiaminopimelate/putrescine aminotransferase
LEPIQGEGGVRIPPPGYLKAVGELCKANGSLLIIDEEQTGFCRTGSFFAIDGEQIEADILTMGKGIAGGLPFAAFADLMHGIRGKGLLLAFDAGDDDKVAAITQACINQGLLVTPTRNGVVRLLPGLLITVEEIDEGMHRLDLALADLQKGWGPLCMQQRQVVNSR